MFAVFKKQDARVYDKHAFVLACVGGIVAIWLLRWLGESPGISGISGFDWSAIASAVAIIVAYALYVWRASEQCHVSLDRASDNVYYLGLLFTLGSLSYSLTWLTVSLNTDGSLGTEYILGLLPDFGIALVSTIAGIVGRILLQQNVVEGEEQVRDALRGSMYELRRIIGHIILDLNGLAAQARIAQDEARRHATNSLKYSALQAAETIDKAAGAVTDSLEEATEKATETLDKAGNDAVGSIKAATESAAGAIESVAADITGNLKAAINDATVAVRSAADTVFTSQSDIARLVENIKPIAQQFENARDVLAAVTGVTASMESVDAKIQEVGRTLSSMGEILDAARRENAEGKEVVTALGDSIRDDMMAHLQGELRQASDAAARGVEVLRSVIEPMAENFDGVRGAVEAVTASVRDSPAKIASMETKMDAMRDAVGAVDASVKEAGERFASLQSDRGTTGGLLGIFRVNRKREGG